MGIVSSVTSLLFGLACMENTGESYSVFVALEVSPEQVAAIAQQHQGLINQPVQVIAPAGGYMVYNVNDSIVEEMWFLPHVVSVEPDAEIQLISDPQESTAPVLGATEVTSNLKRVGGPYVGPTSLADVGVAIIDSGVLIDHKELNVVEHVDFVCDRKSDCAKDGDAHGHGTHVAGIVGARADLSGMVGMAPGVPLYSLRVMDKDGKGAVSDILLALDYVLKHPEIRVVNMSLVVGADHSMSDALRKMVKAVWESGVFISISAGNQGTGASTVIPPAFGIGCVVSSYDASAGDRGFASSSNDGPYVDIAAPGVRITSTWKDGSYKSESGTSMAAPHVTGAAAVWYALYPNTTPDAVKKLLITTGEGNLTGASSKHREPLLDFTALNLENR